MRKVYIISPWVGAGTTSNAYRTGVGGFIPSWAAQVVNNFTCWDPTTGYPKSFDDMKLSIDAMASQKTIVSLSSSAISEIQVPDWLAIIATQPPFMGVGLDEISNLIYCVQNKYNLVCSELDKINDPIDRDNPAPQCISIIDEMLSGDELQQNLWSYYRDIFTPIRPTPESFPYLYEFNIDGSILRIKIDICQEIINKINDPINYSNPVYLADYCYSAILLKEILDWSNQ